MSFDMHVSIKAIYPKAEEGYATPARQGKVFLPLADYELNADEMLAKALEEFKLYFPLQLRKFELLTELWGPMLRAQSVKLATPFEHHFEFDGCGSNAEDFARDFCFLLYSMGDEPNEVVADISGDLYYDEKTGQEHFTRFTVSRRNLWQVLTKG